MQRLAGYVVLTRYNNGTYRVDDIAFDKSPQSTFEMMNGLQASFIDYYKRHYNKASKTRSNRCSFMFQRKKKKIGVVETSWSMTRNTH